MTALVTLLRKELRQLWPFFALLLGLVALNLFNHFVLTYPDESDRSGPGDTSRGVFEFIFAYFVVHSTMSREDERHSIEFLGGLPLERQTLFIAKVLAAFILLVLDSAFDQIADAAFYSLRMGSLSVPFEWTHWATLGFVELVQTIAFLGLAFFFTSFRRFAIPLASVAIGAFVLAADVAPKLSTLNVLVMTQPHYDGLSLKLAWPQLGAAAALGGILLGISGRLYSLDPDTLPALLDRLRARRAGLALVIALSVTTAVAILWSFDLERDNKTASTEWGKVDATTKHYAFVYLATQRLSAAPLIAEAETVYQKVASFFDGAQPPPIAVDLSGSRSGTLGTAHWTSVNIHLAATPALALQLAVLGHETTHVFISHLSDRRLDDHMSEAQFFHEGLARYVQIHAFGSQREIQENVFVSAVMHARKRASFATLVDATKLAQFDEDSVYPLGAEVIEALVRVYGPKAPMNVLTALAQKPELRDQHGEAFWRLALAAAGYSLDAVISSYATTLKEEARKQRARIDALPSLKTKWVHENDHFTVKLDEPLPELYELVCRFKPKPSARPDYGDVIDNASCVSKESYETRTLSYQVGMKSKANEWTLFEPWAPAE